MRAIKTAGGKCMGGQKRNRTRLQTLIHPVEYSISDDVVQFVGGETDDGRSIAEYVHM